ncbi:sensor histidine kinase [Paenalcaligenes hominis]|uniref:sensor histidine kinase n=1 Tax=Paenalcaligenes hominis TaxID=643674 RepID=UPI00352568EF
MRVWQTLPPVVRYGILCVVLAGLFIADTRTDYEVAVAVFYILVIITTSHGASQRHIISLAAVCIVLTSLSFALTPHGDLHGGLINLSISLATIAITSYLIIQIEKARQAALQAQNQLLRLARVQSLEGLTSSIAHEVNQPLAALITSGHASQRWLAQHPPQVDKAQQALQRLLDSAERASNIIKRVQNLIKSEPAHKQRFDIHHALEEIVALSAAELRHQGVEVQYDFNAQHSDVWADRVQIQQVIANLIVNALDAMQDSPIKKLVLRTRAQKNAIQVEIYDTGPGIDQPEAIFEAFWTTKDQGVGVGLSMSRSIVESNGGTIWVHDPDHSGACVCFTVPQLRTESLR